MHDLVAGTRTDNPDPSTHRKTSTRIGRSPGTARWKRRAAALLMLALASAGARADTPLRVVYPHPESGQDRRADYPLALLKLALQRSGVAYTLQPARAGMQQDRALRQLMEGRDIDVVWTVATREREHDLLPVRIPIDRGLIGWRVLLIRADEQPGMDKVRSIGDLRRFRAGQGHDWPDLAILRANGLPTAASSTYDGLFKMLAMQRIDYVPRSIAEVEPELARHASLHLAIEQHLLLHYPSALYYFVNRRNQALADAIARGLRRAIRDGSMQALFQRDYGTLEKSLALHRRRRIELVNPLFPGDASTGSASLWFKPAATP